MIQAARDGELARLPTIDALAVELAEAVTLTPGRVSQDLYERALNQFGRQGLVELTAAISWKNYLARFNRVYDVPEDEFPA